MNTKHFFLIILNLVLVFHAFAQDEIQKTNEFITKIAKGDSLVKKNKILPLAIPITEPAVGYGLVVGVMYFLPKDDPKLQSDILLSAAGMTTNGTWFAGGGYLGYWKKDNLRYTGFSGYGKITMDYYGLGSENPIQFDQNVFFLMQELRFRIGNSDFFLGGKYQLSKISIPKEISNENEIDPDDLEAVNSGISFVAEFDNLNHFLSPTDGIKIHFSYDQNMKILGSSRDWGTLNFSSIFYFPITEWWIPSFRAETHISTGTPPFYAYPYVELRGIPALRYQGKMAIVLETEQLFNITERWGIVGFTGIGTAIKSVEDDSNEIVWNAGTGVRFLTSKSLGVKVGLDLARGPEDWNYYFTVGSAW